MRSMLLGSSHPKILAVEKFGADDRNRTGMGLHPTDFHTTSAFAAALGVRGLDYPFAVLR